MVRSLICVQLHNYKFRLKDLQFASFDTTWLTPHNIEKSVVPGDEATVEPLYNGQVEAFVRYLEVSFVGRFHHIGCVWLIAEIDDVI